MLTSFLWFAGGAFVYAILQKFLGYYRIVKVTNNILYASIAMLEKVSWSIESGIQKKYQNLSEEEVDKVSLGDEIMLSNWQQMSINRLGVLYEIMGVSSNRPNTWNDAVAWARQYEKNIIE